MPQPTALDALVDAGDELVSAGASGDPIRLSAARWRLKAAQDRVDREGRDALASGAGSDQLAEGQPGRLAAFKARQGVARPPQEDPASDPEPSTSILGAYLRRQRAAATR